MCSTSGRIRSYTEDIIERVNAARWSSTAHWEISTSTKHWKPLLTQGFATALQVSISAVKSHRCGSCRPSLLRRLPSLLTRRQQIDNPPCMTPAVHMSEGNNAIYNSEVLNERKNFHTNWQCRLCTLKTQLRKKTRNAYTINPIPPPDHSSEWWPQAETILRVFTR